MRTVADTMSTAHFRKLTVRLCHFLTVVLLTTTFVLVAYAGLRGPGKYCGVVVLDRWDACFFAQRTLHHIHFRLRKERTSTVCRQSDAG